MIAVDTSFPPGRGYPEFANLMEDLTRPLGFEHRREVPAVARARSGVGRGSTSRSGAAPVWWRSHGPRCCGLAGAHSARLSARRRAFLGWARPMKGTIVAVLLAARGGRVGIELAYVPTCCSAPTRRSLSRRSPPRSKACSRPSLNLNGSAAPLSGRAASPVQPPDPPAWRDGHTRHGNRAGRGVNAIEQALPVLGAAAPALVARRQCIVTIARQRSTRGGSSSALTAHQRRQIPALFDRRQPALSAGGALRGGGW